MAVVIVYRKSDLLITMTCNTNWPEIQDNPKENQTASGRSDVVVPGPCL